MKWRSAVYLLDATVSGPPTSQPPGCSRGTVFLTVSYVYSPSTYRTLPYLPLILSGYHDSVGDNFFKLKSSRILMNMYVHYAYQNIK